MARSVKYVRAIGIHNRFDLELDFLPGVNILHGKNGTGKTTLLHILANILNSDFERFAFLPFETIEVALDDSQRIKLRQYTHSEGNKIEVIINDSQIMDFDVSTIKETLGGTAKNPRPGQIYLQTPTQPSFTTKTKPILSTAYFPAFRTLIEAYTNEGTPYSYIEYYGTLRPAPVSQAVGSTEFARRFFGDFVPLLNYPSPEEVSSNLSKELQQALNKIADTDRQLLSKAFLDIFATLSSESSPDVTQPDQILEKIKTLLENTSIASDTSTGEEVYSQLRELVASFKVRPGKEDTYVPILEVYKSSLEERAEVQRNSLRVINKYLESVNRFLDEKQLILRKSSTAQAPILQIKFQDSDTYSKIQALSSGERQIVTLLYSATHMSGQRLVLIDEPEISLHIDWQSLLIPEMVAQLQDRQIITCTHSPMIGAAYEDRMIELEIKPTSKNSIPIQETLEVAEDDIS